MSISKYNYNKDYFETINSSDKAYWLGFLYADGCINSYYKNNKLQTMNLEISLCELDSGHLQKFLNCIESNVPIKHRVSKYKNKEYNSSRINICSMKMCYDLCDKGCVPRKTYIISFPDLSIVPRKYMRDFIRGYFDGDGCIYVNKDNTHIQISFTGMPNMLKGISDFLISEGVLRVNPKLHQDKRSKSNDMYIYGIDSIKEVLDYLYKDANVYLDRKYQKYINFYKDKEIKKYGVYLDKSSKKYIATISIKNKNIRLGSFESYDEAVKCRKNAEIEKMKICQLNQ